MPTCLYNHYVVVAYQFSLWDTDDYELELCLFERYGDNVIHVYGDTNFSLILSTEDFYMFIIKWCEIKKFGERFDKSCLLHFLQSQMKVQMERSFLIAPIP